ncbi:hypothetical protein HN51_019962 [Arachis hypogaea]|uniref:Uncharacterized protein n=1 Tax=Arachis hypogaea TaxID=3818 RepID=A0A445BZ64_ARAHY|nr:stress response protein NST1 [Arachis hypogaea]QHO31809.1 Midasin [Arachis hypogaea]RYR43922.1 hypothetical protein Ahy_A08g040307 [Arachis hypogaea]
METERPHRSNSNSSSSTSELFVCFTSRLSSSSMKLSSKSLLSPSRTSRDPPPQISLSSSLSRRLRSNGSIKGGGQASPMFPATAAVGGKRRGCGFENPEPSSPKVTCIGQVRVKTKKQGKKMRVTRSKSKRRTTTTSEASFRRTSTEGGGQITNSSDLTRQNSSSSATYLKQQHRNNQKWVHLPLTICEALREFNCFFPCRSSCIRDKGDKGNHHHDHHHHHHGGREGSSCGAAFARWLHLALQEGKEREIEVMMGEEENEVEYYDHDDDGGGGDFGGRSHRRHVFEDIDIDVVEGKKEEKEEEEEEEKGRVSICIPPKNALLLMRCRSDPVKMAALANRFWDSPVHKDQHQHQDDEEEEEEAEEEENNVDDDVDKQEREHEQEDEMEEGEEVLMKTEEERISISERDTEAGFVNIEEHTRASSLMEQPKEEEEEEEEEEEVAVQESCEIESRTNAEFSEEARESNNQHTEEEGEETETEQIEVENEEEENHNQDGNFSCVSTLEPHPDPDKPEETSLQEEKKQENDESSELYSIAETLTAPQQNDEAEPKTTTMPEPLTDEEASTEEEQQQNVAAETPPPQMPEVTPPANEASEPNNGLGSEERKIGSNGEEKEAELEREKEETLPECLLLMMCEPKLSMEVSKETWVCSTDFIRWRPERPAGKNSGAGRKVHAAVEGRNSVDKKATAAAPLPPVQPGRSSCSFPAAPGLSMAAMIEQKLAAGPKSNAGYEPFVLTRCKSEPMRTTAKLAADACFWKKPHAPPPTLGVGAPAGIGF